MAGVFTAPFIKKPSQIDRVFSFSAEPEHSLEHLEEILKTINDIYFTKSFS
jgi:hypothetical protein